MMVMQPAKKITGLLTTGDVPFIISPLVASSFFIYLHRVYAG
jgi:hypothetical protein